MALSPFLENNSYYLHYLQEYNYNRDSIPKMRFCYDWVK